MGKYLTFMTTGSEVVFIAENTIIDKILVYAAIAGGAAVLLLILIAVFLSAARRKKRKPAPAKDGKEGS